MTFGLQMPDQHLGGYARIQYASHRLGNTSDPCRRRSIATLAAQSEMYRLDYARRNTLKATSQTNTQGNTYWPHLQCGICHTKVSGQGKAG